jgi:hypothetical protein
MADVYSERVNPLYDEKRDLHYYKKLQFGNSSVFVIVPDISEKERQKRLQATLDVMSAIATRRLGIPVRYVESK